MISAANGQVIDLPVILDLVQIDEQSGEQVWGSESDEDNSKNDSKLELDAVFFNSKCDI